MNTSALERVCQKIVSECTGLDKGEVCLLVKDLETSALHRGFESAVLACDAVPLVLSLPEAAYVQGPLPRGVELIMTSADVVLLCTRELFPHAPRRAATQAGARLLSLGTVTEEMALRALDVDYEELSRVTRSVADAIAQASEMLVTSRAGTEIRMSIADQPVTYLDGLAREAGKSSALPAGVVATLPVPGSAEGKVVLNGSAVSIGLLYKPITLTVEGGKVTDIQGEGEAERLLEILEAADENAWCIAEIGLGTNPKAIYTGDVVEDERVRGSGHIGLGGNVRLGGTIESSLHLDATIRKPTIYLDGQVIVRDGKLLEFNVPGTCE